MLALPLISSWSYLHICTGEEINKAMVEDGKVEKDKEREDTNIEGRRHKRTGEKTQTHRGEDTNAQERRKGQRRKVDKGKEEKNGMFQLSVFPEG